MSSNIDVDQPLDLIDQRTCKRLAGHFYCKISRAVFSLSARLRGERAGLRWVAPLFRGCREATSPLTPSARALPLPRDGAERGIAARPTTALELDTKPTDSPVSH
jgi:hypothetical protein